MTTLTRLLGDSAMFLGRAFSTPEDFAEFAISYGVEVDPQTIRRSDLEAVFAMDGLLPRLREALLSDDLPSIAEGVARFVAALHAASRRSTVSLPFPFNEGWFWTDVAARSLADRLLNALLEEIPSALSWLELFGLAEVSDLYLRHHDGNDGDLWRGYKVRARLDRLPLLLRPDELLQSVYGWGSNFDYLTATLRISRVLEYFGGSMVPLSALVSGPAEDGLQVALEGELDPLLIGFGSEIVDLNPRAVEELGVPEMIAVLPGMLGVVLSGLPVGAQGDTGLGVRLYLGAEAADLATSFVRIHAGAVGTYGLHVRPSGVRFVGSVAGILRATIDLVRLLGRPTNDPLVLGGTTRLSLEALTLAIEARATSAPSGVNTSITFEARRARFVLGTSEGDGFLRSILPPESISADFEFGLGWSSNSGFHFRGAASLDMTLPLRISIIDVLELMAVHMQVHSEQSSLVIAVSLSLNVRMGPVSVRVSRLGTNAVLAFPTNGGNLGPANFTAGFLPPNGLNLSLEAGPVRASGFIAYDNAIGRYSGALSFTVGKTALCAVGILDTRALGVSGYSFLIVISSQFSPLQLGMGFTLMGVGGLCGIQRSISLDALQSGVRDGSLTPLLFARDPVGQASQLVTGLQRVFPPTPDRYVFGPMFKLGWGTPTLVTADLGIILQLPAPVVIALIGTLRATFPKPQAAVVVFNIDIAGSVDPAEKRLAIDARIRDSRIAGYTLTGDMALRLRWGDRPDFALALGGFHRAYQPPEGFPELRRLSLGLSRGNTFRMTCAAYLALTSNSLQLGARAEIFVQTMGFNVLGYLEFNALVMFSPFSFRFDFAAGLSLRRGTRVLAGITVAGLVSGPQPWRVQGSASISILFFELSVSFDVEFGQPQVSAPAQPAGLWDRLHARVQDLRSWTAVLPPETHRVVSLSSAGGTEAPLRLDPMGGLRFTQTEVPLERRITRFGEMTVEAPTTFRVQTVQIQARNALATPVQESFAPGQYQHLTEAEKLSRPSFEPMDAGMSLCADAIQVRGVVERTISYQTLEVSGDDETPPTSTWPYDPSAAVVAASLDFAGAQLAPLYTTGDDRFLVPGAAPLVVLDDEPYLVVHASSLRPLAGQELNAFPGSGTTTAPGAAHDALAAFLCAHPEARGRYRVVPRYEAAHDDT